MAKASVNPAEPVLFDRLHDDDNACTVSLAGQRLRLRHRPTRLWLAALADQKLHEIMPGMLRERDLRTYMMSLADPRTGFDLKDSHKITHAVVREVTGVPWWTAVRLANALGRSWFLADGSALLRGVNLLALPIRRTLSITYVLASETCENERDRIVLDNDLFRAPEGYDVPWTAEQQSSSFAAFRMAAALHQARPLPGR